MCYKTRTFGQKIQIICVLVVGGGASPLPNLSIYSFSISPMQCIGGKKKVWQAKSYWKMEAKPIFRSVHFRRMCDFPICLISGYQDDIHRIVFFFHRSVRLIANSVGCGREANSTDYLVRPSVCMYVLYAYLCDVTVF